MLTYGSENIKNIIQSFRNGLLKIKQETYKRKGRNRIVIGRTGIINIITIIGHAKNS